MSSPLAFKLTYGIVLLISLSLFNVNCEHFIDLSSGGSGPDSISPYLVSPSSQQSPQPYLIPFKAIDTVKYLSSLKRHKRSQLYDLPRVEVKETDWVPVNPLSRDEGYLVHRDLPLIYM